MKPVVAIVGRANVGKSTLFNRLTDTRRAIVDDFAGVTRDRLYEDVTWSGKTFTLIDTGGIELKSDDEILKNVRFQAEIAIEESDVILYVVDVTTGVTSEDEAVAQMLRKSGKPVILVVNKVEQFDDLTDVYEFYSLGMDELIPISASHGTNTGDLLDAVYARLEEIPEAIDEEDDRVHIAVVGRPNVGKSSLTNAIIGEERSIVSNVAGTTRDATDTVVENEHGKFVFIDTAGIRRKSKVEEAIERYSVLRAYMAIDRSNVCIIMIDATRGFSEQDSKIAGYAHEQGKACIIAVNKWDAVEDKTDKTMQEMKKKLENDFSFMPYAPMIFISAMTGQRVGNLYEMIKKVDEQNARRISTGMLNDMLSYATARVQPPSDKGKRLKIYYMTQVSTRPPAFACFVNKAELFHFSYQRYLENQIRENFGFEGTPIRMLVREKGEKNK